MTNEQFENLHIGDIVKSMASNSSYVVIVNYGNRVTAVKIADITNPTEWHLLAKAEHKDVP